MKKIIDILKSKQVTLSYEVFPPKTSASMESVLDATEKIAELKPDFMSVTYGAGGGTSEYTAKIASEIQEKNDLPMLAHLTCVSSTHADVEKMIEVYKEKGISNIMALRGDIPADGRIAEDYHYAYELVNEIKEKGDFCIGGACYPEGHPESLTRDKGLKDLKYKVDAGCDFLTTQMFFDNNIFYHFLYTAREAGIMVPIVAGIMPITNAKQIRRTLELSGTQVPEKFKAILDRFGETKEAMKQARIIYASNQIIDLLAHGLRYIHVYSMNKPEIAEGIKRNLQGIV